MVDPCTIMDIFKPHCELNNNVTIMVELAVGGGLAAFLYWMQHKSTKKQRVVWESHSSKLYHDYEKIFVQLIDYYMSLNPGKDDIIGIDKRKPRILNSSDDLLKHYKKLEISVRDDKEFVDVKVIEYIKWFVDNCEKGPFDIFQNDKKGVIHWRLSQVFRLIEKAKELK